MTNNARNELGKQKSIRFYKYQERQLKYECETNHTTVSSLVRRAVNDYMNKKVVERIEKTI